MKLTIKNFADHFTPSVGSINSTKYVPYKSRLSVYVDKDKKQHIIDCLIVRTTKKHSNVELYVVGNNKEPIIKQPLSRMSFNLETFVALDSLVHVPRLLG